jgi:hypothetical protein
MKKEILGPGWKRVGEGLPPGLARLKAAGQGPYKAGGPGLDVDWRVRAGSTDSVPAMLTPGEAVLNRGAARMVGRPVIDRLNEAGMPEAFAPSIYNEGSRGREGNVFPSLLGEGTSKVKGEKEVPSVEVNAGEYPFSYDPSKSRNFWINQLPDWLVEYLATVRGREGRRPAPADITPFDPVRLQGGTGNVIGIGEVAPDELSTDWKQFQFAVDKLRKEAEKSGVDTAQIAGLLKTALGAYQGAQGGHGYGQVQAGYPLGQSGYPAALPVGYQEGTSSAGPGGLMNTINRPSSGPVHYKGPWMVDYKPGSNQLIYTNRNTHQQIPITYDPRSGSQMGPPGPPRVEMPTDYMVGDPDNPNPQGASRFPGLRSGPGYFQAMGGVPAFGGEGGGGRGGTGGFGEFGSLGLGGTGGDLYGVAVGGGPVEWQGVQAPGSGDYPRVVSPLAPAGHQAGGIIEPLMAQEGSPSVEVDLSKMQDDYRDMVNRVSGIESGQYGGQDIGFKPSTGALPRLPAALPAWTQNPPGSGPLSWGDRWRMLSKGFGGITGGVGNWLSSLQNLNLGPGGRAAYDVNRFGYEGPEAGGGAPGWGLSSPLAGAGWGSSTFMGGGLGPYTQRRPFLTKTLGSGLPADPRQGI